MLLAKLVNAMIEMNSFPSAVFFYFILLFNVNTMEIQIQHPRQMTMTDATEQVNDRDREGELNEANETLIKHLTIISLCASSDPSQCVTVCRVNQQA